MATKHVAHAFSQEAIDFDDRLTDDFLGSDFASASDFAVKSGIPVLITAAALPKSKREEVARTIRAGMIAKLVAGDPKIGEFTSELAREESTAIHSGERPIHEIDASFVAWKVSREAAVNDLVVQAKDELWAALRALLADESPLTDLAQPIPRFLVVRGDGQMRLFRRDSEAKAFFRAYGEHRTFMVELDMDRVRFNQASREELAARIHKRTKASAGTIDLVCSSPV